MDAVAGALHLALAALDLAVIDADLHEGRGRHLGPVHPERNLVVAIAAAGHHEGQMIEDALVEAVHEGESMRRRQIDPRLPLLGAAFPERVRRNPELHDHLPRLPASRRRLYLLPEAWTVPDTPSVAQSGAALTEFTADLPSRFAASPDCRPCESRNPYREVLTFRTHARGSWQQPMPVVMGPCFRRDDDQCHAERASAPSIIATALGKP